MSTIDQVFEGGGDKGIVFIGALEVLFEAWGRHLFSFVERGGWYSADPVVQWATRKLNEGQVDGQQQRLGNLTLKEFFDQTQVERTLAAADTTWARILWLNHRTAPDCPAVWAARMSMSVLLLWQEVE